MAPAPIDGRMAAGGRPGAGGRGTWADAGDPANPADAPGIIGRAMGAGGSGAGAGAAGVGETAGRGKTFPAGAGDGTGADASGVSGMGLKGAGAEGKGVGAAWIDASDSSAGSGTDWGAGEGDDVKAMGGGVKAGGAGLGEKGGAPAGIPTVDGASSVSPGFGRTRLEGGGVNKGEDPVAGGVNSEGGRDGIAGAGGIGMADSLPKGAGLLGGATFPATGKLILTVSRLTMCPGLAPSGRGGRVILTVSFFGSSLMLIGRFKAWLRDVCLAGLFVSHYHKMMSIFEVEMPRF